MHKHAKRLLALAALSLPPRLPAPNPGPPSRSAGSCPTGRRRRRRGRAHGRRRHGKLGQTIVVENRPGAATIIGATAVSQAEPSGYMIGTADHLALELSPSTSAIRRRKLLHVPHQGWPPRPAIQDLLGGQVDVMFIDLAAGLPNVKAGKLRVLAAATPERVAVLPDAPTMAEQGVANFTAYAWQGLVAPAGVPENVVKKLSADLDATLKTPAVSQKMMDMGVIPMPLSAQEFKAYADQERAAWADVIKKAGIKLE